ncbi:hypothetical protein DHEL01_v212402 [Diaporthe helianthi]|uniref:Coat protein n=1 Tax=Diaporthe helianthi TaxID=158607 RepID=A0A2P5HG23_DIAHE|nr:hypothetical protein DHEL01_v212402 [Diaporthe helianthi]
MSQNLQSPEAPEQLRGRSEPPSATRAVPPHVAILRDSVQHIGVAGISRPGISSYIPTAFNMFAMLEAMCENLAPNRHVHDICPEFFTPVLYLYYSHVVYFHILRARAFASALTRSERLPLIQYQRVGPAESWPVAAPLIGFIQAMGAHMPEDSYYSWIVPSLPDFSHLKKNRGLVGLEKVPGMLRLPIIPALQKLVHNFGTGAANFKDGIMHPMALPLSDKNQFIGISSSGIYCQAFLAVTYNLCWKSPFEAGDDDGAKRNRISRWNVPDVPNDATLNTPESFLGLSSSQSSNWMNRLLVAATSVNRFFPNSTTLSKIPPFTTLGSLTHVQYRDDGTPPAPLKDTWYYYRAGPDGVTVDFQGFSNTQAGLLDTRLGVAT